VDLRSLFRGEALENALEEVVHEMIGPRRWRRLASRKDVRNGTYLRRLLTTVGAIDVEVPRTREGGSPAEVIGRYERRAQEIDDTMPPSARRRPCPPGSWPACPSRTRSSWPATTSGGGL